MSEHAHTRARRAASPPHTQARRRSHRTANDDGWPILGRGTHTHVTRRHETGSGTGQKKSHARRSSHGEPHAARRPEDARHGGPSATQNGRPAARVALRPATLSPRPHASRGRGEVEKRATAPLLLPAEKTPCRLPLQRCSSAKNNDAGTHKVKQ